MLHVRISLWHHAFGRATSAIRSDLASRTSQVHLGYGAVHTFVQARRNIVKGINVRLSSRSINSKNASYIDVFLLLIDGELARHLRVSSVFLEYLLKEN